MDLDRLFLSSDAQFTWKIKQKLEQNRKMDCLTQFPTNNSNAGNTDYSYRC